MTKEVVEDMPKTLLARQNTSEGEIDHDWLVATYDYQPEFGSFTMRGRIPYPCSRLPRAKSYKSVRINGVAFQIHRLAWFYVHKKWPLYIDHINGDRSDNRLVNLREATPSLNSINRRQLTTTRYGYRGIRRKAENSEQPFWAQIKVAGKTINSRYFASIKDAARAYDTLAKEHFGEFAVLNFPEEAPARSESHVTIEKTRYDSMVQELATLRSAAARAPDAGLVERHNIVRLIAGTFCVPSDFIVNGLAAFNVADWQKASDLADAILALLSTRAGAGEPVAVRKSLEETVDVLTSSQSPSWVLGVIERAKRALATPAPSGRDPDFRQTFIIPDGFEAVRDAEGRATGKTQLIEGRDPATIEALEGVQAPSFNASLAYILHRGFEAAGSHHPATMRDEMLNAIRAAVLTEERG